MKIKNCSENSARKKFSVIFTSVKWWEVAYLLVSLVVVIVLGVVFKSGAVPILFSLLNIFTIFALGKGWIWGNVVGIVSSSLYIAMSIINQLYGEAIMSITMAIPAYALSVYTWIKNSQKDADVVSINKSISLREWIFAFVATAALGVGIYYLLEVFNTAFLLVSTFSTAICLLARYMQVRRSEYNFLCYIFANLISVVLWAYVAATDFSYISTVITFSIQTLMNVVAFVNWIRMKKWQNVDEGFEIIKQCCLKGLEEK